MFLKKHFKALLELKIFQVTSDLNTILIQNQDGVWSYRVKYENIIYQKVFYTDTENPSNNLLISFNLSEFLSTISQIHGTQQTFTILENGAIEVYKKKDNTLLNTIQLPCIQEAHYIQFDDSNLTNSIQNKESVIKLCKACKRFSNELNYYMGFNRIALFVDGDLKVFSTDGLHSLEFVLSDNFMHIGKESSYYLGNSYKQSQECIKILENFLIYGQEEFDLTLSQTSLMIKNNHEELILPVNKNEEFSSSRDMYDESNGEHIVIDSNTVKSILEALNKKNISEYRKTYDIKEAFKTSCEITQDKFIFYKAKIPIEKRKDENTLCVYHLAEFLNPKEDYKLYNDRLEGIMSILYF